MKPAEIDDLIRHVESGGTVTIQGVGFGGGRTLTADDLDALHTARAYAAAMELVSDRIDELFLGEANPGSPLPALTSSGGFLTAEQAREVVPSGIIEFGRPLSDADFERFRREWTTVYSAAPSCRTAVLGRGLVISRRVPRSRWQAVKAQHRGSWWLGWWVRRWPVRTRDVPLPTGPVPA